MRKVANKGNISPSSIFISLELGKGLSLDFIPSDMLTSINSDELFPFVLFEEN